MSADEQLQEQLIAEIATRWLKGLDPASRAEAEEVTRALVRDWAEEAARNGLAQVDVAPFHMEELAEAATALPPLQALSATLTERQVRRLSARAFQLARAVLEGRADRERAPQEGRALDAEAAALIAPVGAIADAERRQRLQLLLGDAHLDAQYAVDERVMSVRLGRFQPKAP
jgi:hypothetical protein